MIDKNLKKYWESKFIVVLHDGTPLLSTLIETKSLLDISLSYISSLSCDKKTEQSIALFVGDLAARYTFNVLEFFGLGFGGELIPFVNVEQVKISLANLIVNVDEYILLSRIESAEMDEAPSMWTSGVGGMQSNPVKKSNGLGGRNGGPDKTEVNLLVKDYLSRYPKATVREIHEGIKRERDIRISIGSISQCDTWKNEMELRFAAKPPKVRAARLTDNALRLIGENNDPSEKVQQDEAVWSWILENGTEEQRASPETSVITRPAHKKTRKPLAFRGV